MADFQFFQSWKSTTFLLTQSRTYNLTGFFYIFSGIPVLTKLHIWRENVLFFVFWRGIHFYVIFRWIKSHEIWPILSFYEDSIWTQFFQSFDGFFTSIFLKLKNLAKVQKLWFVEDFVFDETIENLWPIDKSDFYYFRTVRFPWMVRQCTNVMSAVLRPKPKMTWSTISTPNTNVPKVSKKHQNPNLTKLVKKILNFARFLRFSRQMKKKSQSRIVQNYRFWREYSNRRFWHKNPY